MTDHWQVGETKIYRIEEISGPLFDPVTFFPDYDASQFADFASLLKPNHLHEKGRLLSSIHTWVLRWQGKIVLIDTCIGNDKDRMPMHDWDHMDHPYLEQLAAIGVQPEQVDYVFCTHMHVDHVGWNTRLQDGVWVPAFPNARYLASKAELEHVRKEREMPSTDDFEQVSDKVYDDSILPVVKAEQLDLIDERAELLDGLLTLELASGHTPGSMTAELNSGNGRALFIGDVMHHPIQVMIPDWNSVFCAIPETARWTRRKLLQHCAKTGCLMLPAHFNRPFAFYVEDTSEGYRLLPAPAVTDNTG